MLDHPLESAIRERFAASAFARWVGMELVSIDEGESEVRLRLQTHHLNPGGIAHGGIVATLLDAAIGLAQRSRLGMDASHVTMALHVNYVRAVASGTVVARGHAVHSGARTSYGEGELLDGEGRLLARAGGTFLIVSGPAAGDAP